MNVANRLLRNGLDWAFIVGVVFALVLAGKIVPLLVVAGVVPIPFLIGTLKRKRLKISLARLLIPSGIYFAYALLTYFFFTGLAPAEARPVNPDLELYGVAIAMLCVGLLRGLEVDELRSKFDAATPWTLVVAFLVLGEMMFSGYRDGCRVQAAAAWPFIPALIFGTLTFLSFMGWRRFSRRQRNFRLILNSLAIVVVVAFTASRGIALAQAGVLATLALASLVRRFRPDLPKFGELVTSGVAGLLLCGVVAAATGCGPMDRIAPMIRAFDILSSASTPRSSATTATGEQQAPSGSSAESPTSSATASPAPVDLGKAVLATDMSIGIRLEMWRTSLHSIAEAPILGHGSLYLQRLITERYGFEHNHNQYLSWLVTGGLLGLLVGLVFLSIPWIISAGLSTPDRLIMILAVSVFWGIAMLFDSFFNLKFYTHYYSLLCGVLFALVNDMLIRNDD